MTTPQNQNDVIDVEVKDNNETQDNGQNKDGDWTSRAPWTAAVTKQIDAARGLIQDQLKTGSGHIGDLEKKAKDLVVTLQTRVDKVGDRVREEGKDAVGKIEGFRERFGKWPVKMDMESWINLPAEAREEVLSALGIASDRQVADLKIAIEAMNAGLKAALEAQTKTLTKKLATQPKAAPRKPRARKTAKTATAKA